jgi:ParB family chromosome partitioning protein
MMKVDISKINVAERIRKSVTDIESLAENIAEHGLLQPIVVMLGSVSGEFQLLAGLRRLKAVQHLGRTEIEANVLKPADAEEALLIEISENEQRKDFTYTERMDIARVIAEIEKAKAVERMSLGGKGGVDKGKIVGSDLPIQKGQTRDRIGAKVGYSGPTYQRAVYIADHGSPELIEEVDSGKKSVTGAYWELRAKEKAAEKSVPKDQVPGRPDTPVAKSPGPQSSVPVDTAAKMPATVEPHAQIPTEPKTEHKVNPYTQQKAAPLQKAHESEKPIDRMTELEQLLRTERSRAATAESELARLRELHHNAVLHMEGSIENLKMQLEAAHSRIKELEDRYESD